MKKKGIIAVCGCATLALLIGIPAAVWGDSAIKFTKVKNEAVNIIDKTKTVDKASLTEQYNEALEETQYKDNEGNTYCFNEEGACISYSRDVRAGTSGSGQKLEEENLRALSEKLLEEIVGTAKSKKYTLQSESYDEKFDSYWAKYCVYINGLQTTDIVSFWLESNGELNSYYLTGDSFEDMEVPVVEEKKVQDAINEYYQKNNTNAEKCPELVRGYTIIDNQLQMYVELDEYGTGDGVVLIPLS